MIRAASRLLRGMLWFGASAYCLGILLLAALWHYGSSRWWVELSNVFAAWWFAPLLVLVPIAAALRSRQFWALVGVPLAVFLVLFGGRFLPHPSRIVGTDAELRVATFNVQFNNQAPEHAVAAIRAQEADVVAIQELTPVAMQMLAGLKDEFPYQLLKPSQNQSGMGVISRYPLVELSEHADAGGLWTSVDVHGTRVTLVNAHLHFPGFVRRSVRLLGPIPMIGAYSNDGQLAQARGLLAEIARIEGPLVLLGDFNSADREPTYTALAGQLHDAYAEAGWGFGFTFPRQRAFKGITVPMPLVRIDYIWTNDSATATASHVTCAEGADHCMVVADLHVRALDSRE